MSSYININGKWIPAGNAGLAIDNRAFRYGDGFFETIRVEKGQLPLGPLHFERFFRTASILGFSVPTLLTAARLEQEILLLAQKNRCSERARIRVTAWRGQGGLLETEGGLEYCMECWPLAATTGQLNENGLVLGIYPDAQKSPDFLAPLKSANFLLYRMAALYAHRQRWNDAILLNTRQQVCDTCIANIFWIQEGQVFTPPVSDGPVAGVFRQHLLQHIPVIERSATIEDVLNADEVFLTNAIRGIRWVQSIGSKSYTSRQAVEIYRQWGQTF